MLFEGQGIARCPPSMRLLLPSMAGDSGQSTSVVERSRTQEEEEEGGSGPLFQLPHIIPGT